MMDRIDVISQFIDDVLRLIEHTEKTQGGEIDYPLRQECWVNYVNYLKGDGFITEDQADTWEPPAFCHPRGK